MSNLRNRRTSKRGATDAVPGAVPPEDGGASIDHHTLLPLIAALAHTIFLELHQDDLGCFKGNGAVAVGITFVAVATFICRVLFG